MNIDGVNTLYIMRDDATGDKNFYLETLTHLLSSRAQVQQLKHLRLRTQHILLQMVCASKDTYRTVP
jgi:hypothetical protein